MISAAIGGYFELELPVVKGEWYAEAYHFQSARAAFLALLLEGHPTRVWMPWYICDSMIEPLYMAGVAVSRYLLDDNLNIKESITLKPNEWLFYVNYFGVSGFLVDKLLESYPRDQVVIDNSQAFFSPPRDCLATIYSPRKFFGVPDGGYLFTILDVSVPDEVDDGSINRCTYLLKRLASEPDSGYLDYQIAEKSLIGQLPKRMSRLTQHLLSTIDYNTARLQRNENFAFLHTHLQHLNLFNLKLGCDDVPMCYPFRSFHKEVRNHLIKKRIFIPIYWPEITEINVNSSTKILAQQYLPLPCDQRYAPQLLSKLVAEIVGEIVN